MHINCNQCSREVTADNISLENKLAKCSHCNAVFAIKIDDDSSNSELLAPGLLPTNIKVVHTNNGISIIRRWFNLATWFLVLFAIFWNVFMVLWVSMSILAEAYIMIAFGSLHALVGIGLFYSALAYLFNRTIIDVSHDGINIKIGPIPWYGSGMIPRHNIKQLYCIEQIHHGYRGSVRIDYTVHALLEDGSAKQVTRSLDNIYQAIQIEREVEDYLGIDQQEVKGAFNTYR